MESSAAVGERVPAGNTHSIGAHIKKPCWPRAVKIARRVKATDVAKGVLSRQPVQGKRAISQPCLLKVKGNGGDVNNIKARSASHVLRQPPALENRVVDVRRLQKQEKEYQKGRQLQVQTKGDNHEAGGGHWFGSDSDSDSDNDNEIVVHQVFRRKRKNDDGAKVGVGENENGTKVAFTQTDRSVFKRKRGAAAKVPAEFVGEDRKVTFKLDEVEQPRRSPPPVVKLQLNVSDSDDNTGAWVGENGNGAIDSVDSNHNAALHREVEQTLPLDSCGDDDSSPHESKGDTLTALDNRRPQTPPQGDAHPAVKIDSTEKGALRPFTMSDAKKIAYCVLEGYTMCALAALLCPAGIIGTAVLLACRVSVISARGVAIFYPTIGRMKKYQDVRFVVLIKKIIPIVDQLIKIMMYVGTPVKKITDFITKHGGKDIPNIALRSYALWTIPALLLSGSPSVLLVVARCCAVFYSIYELVGVKQKAKPRNKT